MSLVDFLATHYNLATGTYRPFKKENNTIQYINVDSDHPKNIKTNLPSMIEQRLSGLSSSKAIFDEEKGPYEESLKASGYNKPLKFQEPNPQANKIKKKRQI